MAVLSKFTSQLARGEALTDEQVRGAVVQLIAESVTPEAKADFLIALACKGETVAEIAAFAQELRGMAAVVPLDDATRAGEILDVCGTGGDHLNTFNISTTVALVCAAAGVIVAKHGNRAVTSRSGSTDVLEALGIPVELSPEEAARALREHGFAFLWAPKFHPAFKHIAPARKLCAERGQKTIFNFLGPLLNPARPSAQLIGVPRPELCEPMARVLQSLGIRRGMVVCGRIPNAKLSGTATDAAKNGQDAYLDELSTLGETVVAEFYQYRALATSTLDPQHFALQPATLTDLAGGDAKANAEIIRRLLRGEERGPKRDAVLLNAAAGLFLAGKCKTIDAGWTLAAEAIDSGKASAKLAELQSETKPAASVTALASASIPAAVIHALNVSSTPDAVPPIIQPRMERWRTIAALAIGFALLTAAAVLFWFNPADGGYPRCALHALTGLHCPGCGGIRATHQLLHGNVAEAFRLNPLWVIVAPFVGWLLLREAARALAGRRLPPRHISVWWIWAFGVVVALFGILRNLPGFRWLAPS